MKRTHLFTASCWAAALLSGGALAQEEAVEIRVRATADGVGKVQVVEERIVGGEKKKEQEGGNTSTPAAGEKKPAKEASKEEAGATEDLPLRARIFRRVQGLGEKVAGATEALEAVTEDVWGEMPVSEYWIGVQIAPVSPEIRKHLPIQHGVLVEQVYPDSPALQAGMKADDILLQVGDAKIETGPDLIKAVDAAKATELSFIVLRGGKEQKLTVTPTKRAEATLEARTRNAPAPRMEKLQAAQKQFEKALEALRAETQPEGTVDFMLVRPGAFLAQAAETKMPDDLIVQITKEGNKPAKVHVKQGDKSWDTSADKLDVLPKEVRPHVEQFLSGGGSHGFLHLEAPRVDMHRQSFNLKVAPPGVVPPVVAAIPPPFVRGSTTAVPVPATPAVPAVPGVPGVYTYPGAPATAPALARAATVWSQAIAPHTNSDAKLDQILKKLDSLASPDLEEMKRELKSLRKEVDELRKKSVER